MPIFFVFVSDYVNSRVPRKHHYMLPEFHRIINLACHNLRKPKKYEPSSKSTKNNMRQAISQNETEDINDAGLQ